MRRTNSCKASLLLILASLPVLASVYFLAAGRLIEYRQWQRFERGYSKQYSFSLQEVEWIRSGKEIRVKGRMMDLHRFRIYQGQLEVMGIWDHEEEQLHEQFSRMPVSPAQGSDHLPRLLVTLLFTPGLPVQPEWLSEHFFAVRTLFPPSNPADICSGYPAIQLPPPRYNRLS